MEGAAPPSLEGVTAASLVQASMNEDTVRYSLGDTSEVFTPASIFDSAEWIRADGLLAAERPPLDESDGAIVRHLYSKSFGKQFEVETVIVRADLARPGTFFELGFSGDKRGTHFVRVENRSIELLYGLAEADERVVLQSIPSDSDLARKDVRLAFGTDEVRALVGGSEVAVLRAEEARRGVVSFVTNLRSSEFESFDIAGIAGGTPVEDSFR